jgi:hypothetical protein
MYEDTWYSFATQHSAQEEAAAQPTKHRRKESLLQQPTVRTPSTIAVKARADMGIRMSIRYRIQLSLYWSYMKIAPP